MSSLDVVSPEFHLLQRAVAGRYSLVRELGRGGMGIVFLAREVSLDRLVAIKLLPPVLGANPELRDRFLREARTAAQLSHPHIVAIHSVETTGDLVFFVMEYVPGETLGARVRRVGALHENDASRVVQEVAWALAHAHARGVIHRDVKPDNILLEEGTDRAIVTDFGIARAGIADGSTSTPAMGTFHYMSPEQAAGEPVDGRTDIYALGVTAFHAVTGRRPFEGYDGASLIAQQAAAAAPSARALAPGLPTRFAMAIDRAIERNPALRWPSMEEMAQELAAARALAPRLPAPLMHFARSQIESSDRLAMTVGVGSAAAITAVVINYTVDSLFGFDTLAFLYLAFLSVGVAILQLGGSLLGIRQIAARGYGREAALRALRHVDAEARELRAPAPSGPLGSPVVVLLGGLAAAIAGGIWSVQADSAIPGITAILLATLTPFFAVRRALDLRGMTQRWWPRLLATRWGQALWAVGSVGLPDSPPKPTAGEPTALALGGVIGEIYARLPEAQRRLLAAVPDLIVRLEQMAMDRSRSDALQAVTALETLRLDLLRLQAGDMAAESFTTEFAKLRDIGFAVDAAVELHQR